LKELRNRTMKNAEVQVTLWSDKTVRIFVFHKDKCYMAEVCKPDEFGLSNDGYVCNDIRRALGLPVFEDRKVK